jgi:predicted MFS family arabinose efflux permease
VTIWAASIASNIGIAMYDAASRWFMTNLSANPMTVSLVQVAVSLPLFICTVPAGALADVIDPRRLLIVVNAVSAALISLGVATPFMLLLTTFLLGVAGALTGPAGMAITSLLVDRQELEGAIAANNVAFNISRAVGPALGGLAIALFGVATPFWICGASNLGNIAALLWWRQPSMSVDSLPAERLTSAVRVGLHHAAHNPHLRATLIRAAAFFPFASAYWTLLPLVARGQLNQGPEFYGFLLAAIGVGAIINSFALRWLKARLGSDRLVASATVATALALVLFGLSRSPVVALCACIIAGASWTLMLTDLYVSAQVALPAWVRGRGLAVFMTAVFGGMLIGGLGWGQVAAAAGLPAAHCIAAAGAVLAIPLTWRWKLQTAAGIDLSPSMHWDAPATRRAIDHDRGPVLVTVEYRVEPANRIEFLHALDELRHERKRDGAFAWGLFEDAAEQGRFVETFRVESWLEHLHQHRRVTRADRALQERIRALLAGAPRVAHLIASEQGT